MAWTPKGNLKGPKGDTGAAGAKGDTGPAGTNGQGVPTGGTAGQVLRKISATNFATAWVSVALQDVADWLGFTPANQGRQVTAGNGLTGGGNLTADRTLTLGTPSNITATSTNSVTTTSHTHAIPTQNRFDDPTPGNVLTTGSFGWGATSLQNPVDDDANSVTHGTLWRSYATTANTPSSLGVGISIPRDANTGAQIFVSHGTTPGLYLRYQTAANTWNAWSQLADASTIIAAGNGLTGGGTLAANRTITLGTPSTLSGTTTNAVQTNSHTHALSANLSSWDGINPSSIATTGTNTFTGTQTLTSTSDNRAWLLGRDSTLRDVQLNYSSGGNLGFYSPDGGWVFRIDHNRNVTVFGGLAVTDAITASRIICGYDSGTANSVNASGWFRASGNTGLFCATHGGGIYMTDTTYVRTYQNKQMMAADFVMSSDATLKRNVKPLSYNGRLNPVYFRWKENGEEDIGFIAQEVQKQYPLLVGTKGADGTLKLSYSKITTVLSAQLNEAEDHIIVLESQLDDVLARLTKLEAHIWQTL